MLICQITDLHITPKGAPLLGQIETADYLRKAVDHVNRLDPRPDVVLVSGDLTDKGSAPEYDHLRELLAGLAMPFYLIPGNHDARGSLRAAFPDHAYLGAGDGFVNYVIEDWPVRLVALDSTIPGKPGGEMCPDRLAWLDATLAAAPDRPTIVFMHHPPFKTAVAHMDAMGLEGGPAMEAVIRRHPQVERVLCGHLHRPIQMRFGGSIASTAPSTAHQVVLDLTVPGHSSAWNREPAAVQLHLFLPGMGIVSHTSYIGDFGPREAFRMKAA